MHNRKLHSTLRFSAVAAPRAPVAAPGLLFWPPVMARSTTGASRLRAELAVEPVGLRRDRVMVRQLGGDPVHDGGELFGAPARFFGRIVALDDVEADFHFHRRDRALLAG